jgi:transcription elongation factor Elf1
MNKMQEQLKKELTKVFDKYIDSLQEEKYIAHWYFRCPYCGGHSRTNTYMPITHGGYDIIYCTNCDMFYLGL